MDLTVLKSKIDRLINELFDESGIFASVGRDSDGDLFVEYAGTKFYFEISQIPTFEIHSKSWQDLEMPHLSVKIFGRVLGNLTPGATLNKYVVEQLNFQIFTRLWTTASDVQGKVELWQGITLAADALDVSELRNGLIQVIRDLLDSRTNMPAKALRP